MTLRTRLAHSPLGPAVRNLRRRAKRTYAVLDAKRLARRLASGGEPLLGDTPVVVSLTSHGKRVDNVALTVESIGAGTLRPRRLILWLDDPVIFGNLPEALRAQQQRGLEVLLTENYGPHTKYFPYVTSVQTHEVPLVTADDDILYPRYWLRRLMAAYDEAPELVSCYRASVVKLAGDEVAPYVSWPRCKDTAASVTRFATGVSGVVYPPAMLEELAARGDAFRATSPRADDIWLHWVALRTSRRVRQITPKPRHFLLIPGSQDDALMSHNVDSGGNDLQIRALYSREDIDSLRVAGD